MGTLLIALLMLLVTTVAANTCTNGDICSLSCAGCTPNVDKTHDPYDCHHYYLCASNGSPLSLPFTCSDGMHFDPVEHVCVAGEECDGCTGGVNGFCHYECVQSPNDQHPIHSHAFDCGQYYDCTAGSYKSCPPENPYFNGDTCQSDVSRCCSCQPFCKTGFFGRFTMDPADCRRYCYCGGEGVTTDCGTCASGNFDPFTQECSDNMPCDTPPSCYNHIGPDWCIDAYTCQAVGFFAKCLESCVSEYYLCTQSQIGDRVEPFHCSITNTVYDPITKSCVLPQDCSFSLYTDFNNTTTLY